MVRKVRKRLLLIGLEKALIKGLLEHTQFNDQEITAIFSHLSRTINHREIGYFRDPNNPKYSDVNAASKQEVEEFICAYNRFERAGMEIGVVPSARFFSRAAKATEAMRSAVANFNNPNIKWKSEIFIVNAIISWTYLLHAYFTKHNIDYRYRKRDELLLTEDGQPRYWDLSKCIKGNACPLPKSVKANLRYLIAIRNEIEHHHFEDVDIYLAPKIQACALNFNRWMCEWFGEACSIADDLAFAIQFSEISLRSNSDIARQRGLPPAIETVNRLIERNMSIDDYNDPQYALRIFIVPRVVNNKQNADQTVVYAEAGSAIEMAIREVERPKYLAKQIVKMMQDEGFVDFATHTKGGFVEFWKSLDAKNPAKGLGVSVAGCWYWYDSMVDLVRNELKKNIR